jgi:hypothetical protein
MEKLTRQHLSEHVRLPGHGLVSEPELAFHPDRVADRSSHPLDGLLRFGPYSSSLVNRVLDPVRVAAIAPAGGLAAIDRLLRELEERHQPRERRSYLRPFPGFSQVFRVRAVAGEAVTRVELPPTFDDELAASRAPHLLLAERLTREIQALMHHRHAFDVLMIFLPGRWSAGFWGGEEEDFDLHDHLKAFTALQGLPIQIVNDGDPSTALDYYCRCSVAWRLGIALYCKAGGVPWKLAPADDGTAYIGLSYALRPESAKGGRFVTCCSQVFDADGAGLEFIAYSPDEVEVERDQWGRNPFLGRGEMRRVIARSLSLYQRRHGGRSPRRIVVHKTSEFKREEVEGCFDALQPVSEIELLQVQQETPWRGLLIEPPKRHGGKGAPGTYPLLRGSYLPLSGRETLIWTQGNAPGPVGGRQFYKEGKGIPSPLMLRRYAGHGGWERNCTEVLALTKMDWNTDSLYARLPVTVGFAQTLARTIKRLDTLGSRVFPFRLFI